MTPEIRRHAEELARWDLWRLIGYVRYPHCASRSATADDELRTAQGR
jgi:hypothetical protein